MYVGTSPGGPKTQYNLLENAKTHTTHLNVGLRYMHGKHGTQLCHEVIHVLLLSELHQPLLYCISLKARGTPHHVSGQPAIHFKATGATGVKNLYFAFGIGESPQADLIDNIEGYDFNVQKNVFGGTLYVTITVCKHQYE